MLEVVVCFEHLTVQFPFDELGYYHLRHGSVHSRNVQTKKFLLNVPNVVFSSAPPLARCFEKYFSRGSWDSFSVNKNFTLSSFSNKHPSATNELTEKWKKLIKNNKTLSIVKKVKIKTTVSQLMKSKMACLSNTLENIFFLSIMQVELYFQLCKHHFSNVRSCIVGTTILPVKGSIFVNFPNF